MIHRSAEGRIMLDPHTDGWDVIEYVREEVQRQGHDVYVHDGICRVGWMLNAWARALEFQAEDRRLTPMFIYGLGGLIEPDYNDGFGPRTTNVRMGLRHIAPPPERVHETLALLLAEQDRLNPLEFYKEFEEVHPFFDGNGRTGKILLNLKNDTLLRPVFPPFDLFGEVRRNP